MTSQEFMALVAECNRLYSGLGAAHQLDQAFTNKVHAMLSGTGPAVTPREVEDWSQAIERALEEEREIPRQLASKLRTLVTELGQLFFNG